MLNVGGDAWIRNGGLRWTISSWRWTIGRNTVNMLMLEPGYINNENDIGSSLDHGKDRTLNNISLNKIILQSQTLPSAVTVLQIPGSRHPRLHPETRHVDV